MNIVQLRSFVSVVEAGSFSRAARLLGVSQPAVTMQIRTLEDELGTVLLDRQYRQLGLTESGAVLLPFAKQILSVEARALDSLQELSGTVAGSLHVAASTTPGDYLVPPLLGEFVATYPEVRITIEVGNTQATIELVESGTADIGICGAEPKGRKVDSKICGHDELVPICPPTSTLARRQIKPAELNSEDWVMRNTDSGTQKMAFGFLKDAGVKVTSLRPLVELDTGEAVVAAVEGGLGIACVSRYVAEKALRLGTIAEIDLPTRPWQRPFYLICPHRTPSRATHAFAEFLLAVLR